MRQGDIRRRLVVFEGARLLHRTTRAFVIGDRLSGSTVECHGVDHGQQQSTVLLPVGAPDRGAHLERHYLSIGRGFHRDRLLGDHGDVPIDDEACCRQRGRVESRSGAAADQGLVNIEGNLLDLARGVCSQQQRGGQQCGSETHDGQRHETQHACAVHAALASSVLCCIVVL